MNSKVSSFISIVGVVVSSFLGCGDNGHQEEAAPISPLPAASLGIPPIGSVGIPVVFNGSASSGDGLSFLFDFGDGKQEEASSSFTFHVYGDHGAYTANLKVTDRNGNTASQSQNIQILSTTGPSFGFSVPQDGRYPLTSSFPFPNDLFRNLSGTIELSLADLCSEFNLLGSVIIQDALEHLDGFGMTTAIYLPLGASPLSDSMPSSPEKATELGSSIVLIDVDPNSPDRGKRVPLEVSYDSRKQRLVVLPWAGYPLRAGTQYAVLITTSLVCSQGAFLPSPDFVALRNGAGTTTKARDLYAPVLAYILTQPDISHKDVLSVVSVFTTQSTIYDLKKIRDFLATAPPPQIDLSTQSSSRVYRTEEELNWLLGFPDESLPGLDNPGGITHDAISCIALGTFPSMDFRNYLRGIFAFDEHDNPIVSRTSPVPVVMVIPKAPPPPSGYPVVLLQHGVGWSRAFVPTIANDLAKAGFISMGIDAGGTWGQI